MIQRRVTGGAGVFVTGTDTGVGKTLVTAALAIRLRRLGRTVGIMKPIETGVTSSRLIQSDAARLRAAIDSEETLGAICPYQFEQPVAPLGAAHIERRSIDPRVIRQVYRLLANRYQSVVVEGIGGVRVPITANAEGRFTLELRSDATPLRENDHPDARALGFAIYGAAVQ